MTSGRKRKRNGDSGGGLDGAHHRRAAPDQPDILGYRLVQESLKEGSRIRAQVDKQHVGTYYTSTRFALTRPSREERLIELADS